MKKALKIIGITLISIIVVIVVVFQIYAAGKAKNAKELYAQLGQEAPMISVDGESYRDLNKNGKLDVYEDARADIEDRVSDLLGQMTLEEKVGQMTNISLMAVAQGDFWMRRDTVVLDTAKMRDLLANSHVGSVQNLGTYPFSPTE